MKTKEKEIVGQCPICDRDMIKGPSIDKHHFIPKCKGGKDTLYVHRVCHNKIHKTFTEKELANEYNDPNKVCSHSIMQLFIKWIQKKDPEYYDRSETSNRKKK